MKNLFFSALLIFNFFLFSVACAGEIRPVPLSVDHLEQISETLDIPFEALIIILHQENGHLGLASQNENGTYDYGPFQVNSVQLLSAECKYLGITKEMLQYHGPMNALVAGLYFKEVAKNADSLLDAIGRYHSKTPKYKKRYIKSVLARMENIKSIPSVIKKANRLTSYK